MAKRKCESVGVPRGTSVLQNDKVDRVPRGTIAAEINNRGIHNFAELDSHSPIVTVPRGTECDEGPYPHQSVLDEPCVPCGTI